MYMCCLLPLRDILPTVVARYSLFVLKVPLNPKQTNKQYGSILVKFARLVDCAACKNLLTVENALADIPEVTVTHIHKVITCFYCNARKILSTAGMLAQSNFFRLWTAVRALLAVNK